MIALHHKSLSKFTEAVLYTCCADNCFHKSK